MKKRKKGPVNKALETIEIVMPQGTGNGPSYLPINPVPIHNGNVEITVRKGEMHGTKTIKSGDISKELFGF